jgi:hypothetical protein
VSGKRARTLTAASKAASRTATVIALIFFVLALGPAGPVNAGGVGCGDVLTADTRLDADVGPCSDGGLILGADRITLDLNGHAVFGTKEGVDGVGIRIVGRTGVTVTNGAISFFDAGVYIESGGNNEVSRINVHDNVSSMLNGRSPERTASFGDGIVLNSDNNVIRDNSVVHNGPNDGIGVFANSGWNLVRGNVVTDNNVSAGRGTTFDDGIRLESGAHDNLVVRNVVRRNGRTGIAVFAYGGGNVVRANVVKANGRSRENDPGPSGPGFGIRVDAGAAGTVVQNNKVFANSADGIRVDGQSNQIVGNRTGANGADGRGYDLYDSNTSPPCDHNAWSANTFDSAFPDCVKGNPEGAGAWARPPAIGADRGER